MENSVENNEGIVLDDAVQAPETQGESIAEVTEEPKADKPNVGDPGWISARVNDAVRKAENRIRAEYEAKLAPLRESMLDRQAHELVDQGEFKSLERAKEYLQLKGGNYEPPKEEANPVLQARADLLASQADKIKRNRGLDVMSAFHDDPDIKQRVISGEWDFYDVADAMGKKPLSPVRSPNGIGTQAMSIQNMSDEQWARLQKNIAGGRKYDMRK